MDGSENGAVSGELLRLMDQHLVGSRYSPLPPHTKKNSTFTVEKEGADVRLQLCALKETGITG